MRNLLLFFALLTTVLKTYGADEEIYVRLGEDVVLNVSEIPKNYYITWFFENESGTELAFINYFSGKNIPNLGIWKDKLSLTTEKLTISNIQVENIGTFICKVLDSVDRKIIKRTFKLIKVDVSMKGTLPVIPGDDLSLSCKIEGQSQSVTKWKNPMGKLMSTGEVEKKADFQDNGEWKCVVKNQEFKFYVSVVDFSSASKRLYTSTDLPLTVSFLITPNQFLKEIQNKIRKIQWDFIPKMSYTAQTIFSVINGEHSKQVESDKGLIYKNFTKEGNLSLYRQRAREEDRGSYNCSITFTNGLILKSTVFVEVLQITPSSGTELISGNPLNLSCSIGGSLDADIKVKWFPPKTSSQAKAKLSSDPLYSIPAVGTEDSGKWRCELLNNMTILTSAEIMLKIDPILTVWMVVTTCGAVVILILLLIVSFILFRRRQKTRQFRHRLCKCENPKPKGFYKA